MVAWLEVVGEEPDVMLRQDRERCFPGRTLESRVARLILGPRSEPAPGGARIVARGYRDATLLYADVVNLPGLASHAPPERLVAMLDELFRDLDAAAERHGLSRVAVSGETYAAVAGIPDPRFDHARAAAEMALEIARDAARIVTPDGRGVALRVGVHSGPVVAAIDTASGGVHELWGETARVARLMEAKGVPGLVQVSAAAAVRLARDYRLDARSRSAARPDAFLLTGRLRAA